MNRILAGVAVAAAAGVVWCWAEDEPTFSVDVDVVYVLTTVRDRDGHLVSDLEKDDFKLEEDGHRQEIQYFARQTDLPLTIGLLVDTSMSQERLIEAERSAARQFFGQVLHPEDDMAFLIRFDVEVELLQDLTGTRSELEKALDLLETPKPEQEPRFFTSNWSNEFGGQTFPGGIPWPGGGGGGGSVRGGPAVAPVVEVREWAGSARRCTMPCLSPPMR